MPISGRLFARDEELGKKDDDHRPPTDSTTRFPGLLWAAWGATPRVRRRRLLLVILATVVLYMCFRNIPGGLKPEAYQADERIPGSTLSEWSPGQQPLGEDAPPRPKLAPESWKHYYDGKVRFFRLAATLHAISGTTGRLGTNRNVLFAAANLQSAARLIPMACEMARWNRNLVHFAVMGRDDISLNDIKDINGVTNTCDVSWHDARPDFSAWSTDARMVISISSALSHVEQFMRPQVYIVDDPHEEEAFFVKSIREHGVRVGKSVIELPVDAVQRLMWFTRLDYGSLAAWHKTYVDVLIHVQPDSSGALIRLLRSIAGADYFGARRPHITIELPSHVDPPTQKFLESFIWPPVDLSGGPHTSLISLRKRIHSARLSPIEASASIIESFYSARPHDSHVLLLSPRVELSPLYYHYLFYNVLEYKHSAYVSGSSESSNLMGIALDLPARQLDGFTKFAPPVQQAPPSRTSTSNVVSSDPPFTFLWQAPNTDAALYFGNKWQEFHSFLTSRLAHAPTLPRSKIISPSMPAFAEPLLELMRARGYSILYPGLSAETAIATVHNELYLLPEEFSPPYLKPSTSSLSSLMPQTSSLSAAEDDVLYMRPLEFPKTNPSNHEGSLMTAPLAAVLPAGADLPELSSVAIMAYDGRLLHSSSVYSTARAFAEDFRVGIGGCPPDWNTIIHEGSADDLFCPKHDGWRNAGSVDDRVTQAQALDNSMRDGAAERVEVTPSFVPLDVKGEDVMTGLRMEEERQSMTREFERHLNRQKEGKG